LQSKAIFLSDMDELARTHSSVIDLAAANLKYRQLQIWFWRRLRLRDLLQIAQIGMFATVVALVAPHTISRQVTYALTAAYVALFLASAVDVFRAREVRDHAQAQVFAAVCSAMNLVFKNHGLRARFTLFVEPRSQRGTIVPWYRYEEGVSDPIEAAKRSKARYHRGEGITGKAWSEPTKLMLAVLPEFTSEDDFRRYYIDALDIRPAVVNKLNAAFMSRVGAIFAYAFIDDQNPSRVLWILSIDIQAKAERVNGQLRLGGSDFDANEMFLVLQSIRTALAGFKTTLT
jgi:hypothetical protein